MSTTVVTCVCVSYAYIIFRKRSGFDLTDTFPGLSIGRHHLTLCDTIGSFVISHDLTGLEDGLFLGENEPGSLFGFTSQEACLAIVQD